MDGMTVFQMIAGGFAIFGGGCTVTWRVMSSKSNGNSNSSQHISRDECERVHKAVDNQIRDMYTDVKDIQKKVGNIEGTVEATVKSVDGIKISITDIHKKIDRILLSK